MLEGGLNQQHDIGRSARQARKNSAEALRRVDAILGNTLPDMPQTDRLRRRTGVGEAPRVSTAEDIVVDEAALDKGVSAAQVLEDVMRRMSVIKEKKKSSLH